MKKSERDPGERGLSSYFSGLQFSQRPTTKRMSSSYEVSNFLLVSVAILFCITSLLSILGNNHTHTRKRTTFVYTIIVFAFIYLLHLLSDASDRVGTNRRSNKSIHRLECLYSNKGGKRPLNEMSDEYRNPCFNSTDEIKSNNDIGDLSSLDSLTLCPSTKANKDDIMGIEPYISAARDCHQAQLRLCSSSQPCTPCELSRRDEFNSDGWSRCQACSVHNGNGDCNFVAGVGPYCWKNGERLEVVPCETCCTENVAMFDAEGACY